MTTMRTTAVTALLALTMWGAPAGANIAVPDCPPGTTPQTSPYPCRMPRKFYQEEGFQFIASIVVLAVGASIGLHLIRRHAA